MCLSSGILNAIIHAWLYAGPMQGRMHTFRIGRDRIFDRLCLLLALSPDGNPNSW
jgi:hypothetical protein